MESPAQTHRTAGEGSHLSPLGKALGALLLQRGKAAVVADIYFIACRKGQATKELAFVTS